MGHAHGPDGAHTHGSGGGIGGLVLVIFGLVLLASIAGPVVAAVAELVRVVLIVAEIMLGLAVLGGAGLLAWRLRQRRANAVPRMTVVPPAVTGPSQALPAPWRAIGQRGGLHLHFHGLTAEQAAEVVRQAHPAPQPGTEHPAIEED